MFASFLPSEVKNLTEPTSIALAKQIQCLDLATPLTDKPIPTTYVHQGSGGTPILLLHGFDSSVLEFRRLFPLLAAKNDTWTVDFLGFGFTERISGLTFDPVAIKTHLYYFWKTLIQQPVILVGASMGGAAAIDFTLAYPEVVKKLVFLDSAGIGKGPAIGKFLFPPFDYLAAEFLRRPGVRKNINLAAYLEKSMVTSDAELCAALHLKSPNWHQALIAFTKSGGYGSFVKQIPNIQQETLILWGENDKILGTKDAYKFEQLLANSKLIWIKNCGHVPHLEQAEVTAQHIFEFCGIL
ncbi:alpha/beta fold hydrolase [Oscillatoria salina]|uniref:alpha/beta fold hydrolase n=1 Tax=Oscillatoria salina TaxID=331517 RepID=UPI0013BD4AED|nr:alpha/beta hydrolase [Oscillatoria salina]MBZ8178939.1 alpha/beta hydrolase [Oscillatoria salina IIICB1]NET89394.1 alpha/beta hydrolase [Kamptonema sp. SIO1D9]